MLNILVVGGGGREHAIAKKLVQSPETSRLFIAPGNAGTTHLGTNVSIAATDVKELANFATRHNIAFTVACPEESLALGIVDVFRKRELPIFGPTQAATIVESSKAFSKELVEALKIPASQGRIFTEYTTAFNHLHNDKTGFPLVIKADGLTRGKGVYVCKTIGEAERALEQLMLKRVYNKAGGVIVIEECLSGKELSIHAFTDGATSKMFPPSRDYKPAFDGGCGPNTGGMGAFAPVSDIGADPLRTIETTIVTPALATLSRHGRRFVGCLYPGVILTEEGPKTLEFNARFGDPEMQVYMRLLKTDLLRLFEACVKGTLDQITLEWETGYAVCVVIASEGYPQNPKIGFPITGIEEAEKIPGVEIFHAGTTVDDSGVLRTSGGRVLNVTAVGATLDEAVAMAYAAAGFIGFEGAWYRRDIGINV